MSRARPEKWGAGVVLLAVLAACAHDPRIIAPGEVRELCFEAAAGDTIVYRFEGTGPLGFNLHYHEGEEVYYPVPEHETDAEKGHFLVTADQVYCLMWTNNTPDRITVEPSVEGGSSAEFH